MNAYAMTGVLLSCLTLPWLSDSAPQEAGLQTALPSEDYEPQTLMVDQAHEEGVSSESWAALSPSCVDVQTGAVVRHLAYDFTFLEEGLGEVAQSVGMVSVAVDSNAPLLLDITGVSEAGHAYAIELAPPQGGSWGAVQSGSQMLLEIQRVR